MSCPFLRQKYAFSRRRSMRAAAKVASLIDHRPLALARERKRNRVRRVIMRIRIQTRRMIDFVTARGTGAALKRRQLIHKPRIVEQPNATRRELRQHVEINSRSDRARCARKRSDLAKRVHNPFRRVPVADGPRQSVTSKRLRHLRRRARRIERRANLNEAIENHNVALVMRNRQREAVPRSAGRIAAAPVPNPKPRRPDHNTAIDRKCNGLVIQKPGDVGTEFPSELGTRRNLITRICPRNDLAPAMWD